MNIICLLTFALFVLPSSLKSASASPAKVSTHAANGQQQAKSSPAPLPLPLSSPTQTVLSSVGASAPLSQTQATLQSKPAAALPLTSIPVPSAAPIAFSATSSLAALSDLVAASAVSQAANSAGTVGVMVSSPMPAQIPQLQDLKMAKASRPLLVDAKPRRKSLPVIQRQIDATEQLPFSLALPRTGSRPQAKEANHDKKDIIKTDEQSESKNKKKRDSSDASSTTQKKDSGDLEGKDSPIQSESLLWSAFNIVGSGLGILERQTRKMVQTDSAHLLHLHATDQLKTLPKADQIALVARALQANTTKMKTTDGTAFQCRIRKQISVVDATSHKIDADVAREAIQACELFTEDLNKLIAKLKEKSSGKA